MEFLQNLVETMMSTSIIWIYGMAGTGKSCIAGSFADILRKTQDPALSDFQLAISFHCNRASRENDIHVLVPTIVYHLALKHPALREKLVRDVDLDAAGEVEDQINNLLLYPLRQLQEEGAIPKAKKVIILDGFDEWGEEEHRTVFLHEMKKLCNHHHWMRFIITSRPNQEIADELTFEQRGFLKRVDLFQDQKTQHDIGIFLEAYRSSHSRVSAALKETDMMLLLPYVNSLFILADVACKFLSQNPYMNMKILTNQMTGFRSGKNSYDKLHHLYETVLKESMIDPKNELRLYMEVIGAICVLQMPLTMKALEKLTGSIASQVVQSLRAVLYEDSEGHILHHRSFQDFIMSESVFDEKIDVGEVHARLASACLNSMSKQLKFNICRIDSSHFPNDALTNPDISERAQKWISEELRYSCRSWIYHLCATEEDNNRCWDQAAHFMNSKSLIYWIECLSCINEMNLIKDGMDQLGSRTKVCFHQCLINAYPDENEIESRHIEDN